MIFGATYSSAVRSRLRSFGRLKSSPEDEGVESDDDDIALCLILVLLLFIVTMIVLLLLLLLLLLFVLKLSSSFFCFRVIVIASDVCFLFLALDSEALRLEAEDDDALHEKIRAVVLTFMPFMVNISVDSK